jgi:hypothetical protein
MGRAPFLLLVKEKVAAKRPDEVYCGKKLRLDVRTPVNLTRRSLRSLTPSP